MPKINVYLPEDIFARVRKLKLPVSAICQAALSDAITGMTSVTERSIVVRSSLPEPLELAIPLGRHVHDIISISYAVARARGSSGVEPEDLLGAVIEQRESLLFLLLEQHGFSADQLRKSLGERVETAPALNKAAPVRMSAQARALLERAAEIARQEGASSLVGRYLFDAFVKAGESIAGRLILELGIDRALTREVFDACDAGALFGAHGPAMIRQQDDLAVLRNELHERLERIEALLLKEQRTDP